MPRPGLSARVFTPRIDGAAYKQLLSAESPLVLDEVQSSSLDIVQLGGTQVFIHEDEDRAEEIKEG